MPVEISRALTDRLIFEIERYLEIVAELRRQGREPTWLVAAGAATALEPRKR